MSIKTIADYMKEGAIFLPSDSIHFPENTKHYLKLPGEVFLGLKNPPRAWVFVQKEFLEDLLEEIDQELGRPEVLIIPQEST